MISLIFNVTSLKSKVISNNSKMISLYSNMISLISNVISLNSNAISLYSKVISLNSHVISLNWIPPWYDIVWWNHPLTKGKQFSCEFFFFSTHSWWTLASFWYCCVPKHTTLFNIVWFSCQEKNVEILSINAHADFLQKLVIIITTINHRK